MTSSKNVLVIEPAPHTGQLQLLDFLATHRFVLACCGRRFGKTLCLLMDMLAESLRYPDINAWWVDAIYYQARRAFRIMSKTVTGSHLAAPENISKSELRIELITGSVMEFHSAERGDRLRGEGVHRAYLNEASLIKADLWYEALYPMLTDTGGRAAFAFTPKGQGHWTYKEFLKGQSAESPDYASIQLPTSANPYIKHRFLEAAKKDLPADSYRQEYLAEFLPDSSGVFRNIDACTKGELDSPHTVPVNGPYAGGLDLAKHEDYTVLDILDARGRLAWHDRFQRQNWPVMKARIIEAAKRYRAHLVVESNSIGDVIIDDLREAGVSCEGFATTGSSKQGLIQGLMTALEQSLISFPEVPELITELKIFEYDRLPTGAIRYQAPEGEHDDEVIALALAVRGWRGMNRGKDDDWLDGADLDQVLGRRAA